MIINPPASSPGYQRYEIGEKYKDRRQGRGRKEGRDTPTRRYPATQGWRIKSFIDRVETWMLKVKFDAREVSKRRGDASTLHAMFLLSGTKAMGALLLLEFTHAPTRNTSSTTLHIQRRKC